MDFESKNKLIIAGVHKAATTSLYEYLIKHPDVCAGIKKEIHYYTPLRYNNSILPLEWYKKQFYYCNDEKYILDASPSYFYGKNLIANKLKEDLINVKIIIVLRDPTARFLSFYKFTKSQFRLDNNVTFSDFVDESYALKNERDEDDIIYRAFREGIYVNYLEDWLVTYRNNLKIIFFDQIKNNPQKVMKEICSWLDIDDYLYDNVSIFEIKNKTQQSNCKSIYRIASYFNSKCEYFFRNNPNTKKIIRKFYYMINKSKTEEIVSDQELERLRGLYKTENDMLAKLLRKHGYTNLPVWLNED